MKLTKIIHVLFLLLNGFRFAVGGTCFIEFPNQVKFEDGNRETVVENLSVAYQNTFSVKKFKFDVHYMNTRTKQYDRLDSENFKQFTCEENFPYVFFDGEIIIN